MLYSAIIFNKMQMVKVIIVEDHPLFSKGLISLIICQPLYLVVGEASNKADAVELVKSKSPNLAIVDLNLGGEDGMDVIAALKKEDPKIRILVLSMHDERSYAERVLQAGAHGYIMKEEAGDKIIGAIKDVMSGKIYLSPAQRERLSPSRKKVKKDGDDPYSLLHSLTDRQFQIFSLIGKGYGNAEIAAKLDLSSKTIDAHKENIKSKIRCGASQLRQFAIEWNKR